MKHLLIVTASLETAIGLALLVSPSVPASLLLGARLDEPIAWVIARVAGAALLALGMACWLARNDGLSRAVRGLLVSMLLYNTATAAVLVHASLRLALSGIGIWPTVILHLGLAAWCLACIRPADRQ